MPAESEDAYGRSGNIGRQYMAYLANYFKLIAESFDFIIDHILTIKPSLAPSLIIPLI